MDYCALCKNKLQSAKYDLKTCTTSHSATLLIDIIEKITGSAYSLFPTVCEQCFQLLNDFDELNTRLINLISLVKYYVENKTVCIDQEISLCETESLYSVEEKNAGAFLSTPSLTTCDSASYKPGASNSNSNHISNLEDVLQDKIESLDHIDENIQEDHLSTAEKDRNSAKTNKQSFMCEVCGQIYEKKRLLTNHMKIHSFARSSFMCSYCDKSFTQKVSLLRHLPLHTGEKPYQCEVCGKRFVHHTSFRAHKLGHTGERSYKCTYCDLSLISSSHLKRHLRIHTGEKKYACDVCGKQFAENYNLVVHQKLHTVGGETKLNSKNKIKNK